MHQDYFYHYKLTPERTNQFKLDVDAAVGKSKLPPLDPTVLDISTVGGLQHHLMEPVITPMIDTVIETVKDIVVHSLILDRTKLHLASAWTVYGEKGAYHTMHRHNDNDDICTVIYLDVEPEPVPHKHGTFIYWYENKLHLFGPEIGDVLIFPAKTWHGTYPQTADKRHTLNLDFRYERDYF